jgi:hypothetical protein
MAHLEELKRGASAKGVLPDGLVTVVDIKWHSSSVVPCGASGIVLTDELLIRSPSWAFLPWILLVNLICQRGPNLTLLTLGLGMAWVALVRY